MNKVTSKQQYVYQVLRTRILEGTYSPGYRVVINQVAKELSVSSIPVREAIRQLEADGLIEYKPFVGAVVTPIKENEYAEAMVVLAVIEGYATALSAQLFPASKIDELKKINHKMREALDDFDFLQCSRLNQLFHGMIVEHCGNQYLIEHIKQTRSRIDSIRREGSFFVTQRLKQSVQEHDVIISMISERRPFHEVEEYARQHKMNTVLDFVRRREKQSR